MGLKDFFDKVGDAAKETAVNVAKGTQDIGDFIGDKTSDAVNAVGNATKDAIEFVSQTVETVGEETEKAFDNTKDAIENGINAGETFISNTAKNISEGTTQIVDQVKTNVSGVFHKDNDEESHEKKDHDFIEKAFQVGINAHFRHDYNEQLEETLCNAGVEPGFLFKAGMMDAEISGIVNDWKEINKDH